MRAAELDRRITLLEPGPSSNVRGQIKYAEPVRHPCWAARVDRGGGERLQASAVIGTWQTRFTVRWSSALSGIDHTWSLVDERGWAYDIEAVAEIGRREGWWLYAVASA